MTSVGPWDRRSRRTVYENDWLEVWHDEVVRPDGTDGIYGVIHPRSIAVAIVAIDDRERVALVAQYRYPLDERTWELPAGGVPFDEDPLAGARRELAEETGATASTWRQLCRFVLQDAFSDERGVLFLATGVANGEPSPDATEDIEVRWVPFDEALAMVEDGTIEDAMSQLGLLRAERERSL
jgi:8-oxo-dGTP pyrophosphatase MutT (NUDIX family)